MPVVSYTASLSMVFMDWGLLAIVLVPMLVIVIVKLLVRTPLVPSQTVCAFRLLQRGHQHSFTFLHLSTLTLTLPPR